MNFEIAVPEHLFDVNEEAGAHELLNVELKLILVLFEQIHVWDILVQMNLRGDALVLAVDSRHDSSDRVKGGIVCEHADIVRLCSFIEFDVMHVYFYFWFVDSAVFRQLGEPIGGASQQNTIPADGCQEEIDT